MRGRLRYFTSTAALFFVTNSVARAANPMDRIADMIAKESNISMSYQRLDDDTPDLAIAARFVSPDELKKAIVGKFEYRESFAYLDGRLLFHKTVTADTVNRFVGKPSPMDPEYEITYNPTRVEALTGHLVGSPTGVILAKADLPLDRVIDVALGMRTYNGDHWLSAKEIRAFTVEKQDAQNVILSWTSPTGLIHERSYDVTRVPKLMRYTVSSCPSALSPDNHHQLALVGELLNSDFVESQGVGIPRKIVYRHISYPANTRVVYQTTTLTVTNAAFASPSNNVYRFDLVWPKGKMILDERTGQQILIQSDDRVLSDDQIRALGPPLPPTP